MKQNFGGATFWPLVLRALLSDPMLNVAAIAVDQVRLQRLSKLTCGNVIKIWHMLFSLAVLHPVSYN